MNSTLSHLIIYIVFMYGNLFSQTSYHHGDNWQAFDNNKLNAIESELFDVLSYKLEVQIFPSLARLEAKNLIILHALDNLQDNIYLDFAGLITDSVFVNGKKETFTQSSDQLNIEISENVAGGDSVNIWVYYHGRPAKGIYFRTNSYGDTVIYSHNEPYDARYWIPCKDDPSDKALLDFTIKIPEKYIPLSNGVVMEDVVSADGFRTIHWRESLPIATYLISVAAAPYTIVDYDYFWEQSQMPLQYYVYPPDRDLAEKGLLSSQKILDFFNSYIGTYPFLNEKYAMSAVPFREAAAMENQTATTMRDNLIDSEGVIAHELAHQWWGDALTPQSFDHIWLNEGFASYFDAMFTENEYGDEAFAKQMAAYKGYIFQDGSLAYPILYPPAEYLFGRAVYYKGAWVLHMLRNAVGDQVYRNIITSYFNQYEYKNVDTDNFIQICQIQSGQNLDQFFDQWLNYGGIPDLAGQWAQDNNEVTFYLEQVQSEPVYHLNLEIRISSASSDSTFILPLNSRNLTVTIPFSERVTNITIDPDNKILQRNNSPLYIIPTTSSLSRLYPNPFNNLITIEFQSDRLQEITIEIWDVLGQRVATVYQDKSGTGVHQVSWEGKSHASATYFVVMRAQNQTDVRKVLLIK